MEKIQGRRHVLSSLKADRTGEDDMAGIKDVAEYCGVSLSTVSRTMTGSAKVSPETRQKVLQAVKKLNYKPNMTAQMLKSGSARLIGLIIPDIVMNIRDYDSGEVSDALLTDYGISTRSGGHCAPRMHEALGTVEQGAVRFSFSHYNTEEEVDTAIRAVCELAEEE